MTAECDEMNACPATEEKAMTSFMRFILSRRLTSGGATSLTDEELQIAYNGYVPKIRA